MACVSVENIYYLGPDGSNTYLAMLKSLEVCNISVNKKIPCKSIRQVFDYIQKDYSSFGILPCENSIEGIVRETVDNMLNISDSDIFIQGEFTLPINHTLLSSAKNKSEIKEIVSHPQALAQCSRFLHKHYPLAVLSEVSSTSYAAQKIALKNDNSLAAIANESCAGLYKLNVLESCMNDEKGNTTRFYVLGRDKLKKSDFGKTAVMLSTKNKPGALCDVLKIFESYDINLTCIESRPSKKKLGEYLFFMEADSINTECSMKTALEEINEYVDFIKILGSFCIY